MINAKDKKKETLAYRARAKAVDEMMQAGAGRSAAPGMATPAPRGRAAPPPEMAPAPGMAPPAMKKGGKVDFSKIVRDTKTGKLSEKPAMKKGGMAPAKKPGLMIMIAVGKKKGR